LEKIKPLNNSMTLKEIAERLNLRAVSGAGRLADEVRGGYTSDLLSDVMAHVQAGDVWVTLQIHPNIVAVATLKEIAAIIIIGGREPEAATLAKAREENVLILLSDLPAFEVAGRLYQMGICGKR
jgi:hypothetical protein